MKKETIITAIVFFCVGFLAGWIVVAERSSNAPPQGVVAAAPGESAEAAAGGSASAGATSTGTRGLPEGHPPIDHASILRTLEEQAAQIPNDPEPRIRLGDLLYDAQQWQQAAVWYHKALELDPRNVNARTDLGTSYFNLRRYPDALREFQRSLEINPRHEPTLFNIIVVHLEGTRDLGAARQAWERLHKLDPSYPGLDRLKQRLDGGNGASPRPTAPS